MASLEELRSLLKARDPRASVALESVLAFEEQDWVLAFHDERGDSGDDLRIACFLHQDAVEHALTNESFDLGPGDGRPGFVGYGDGNGNLETRYVLVGEDEVVPLVFDRYFSGPFPNVAELAEDFRLFWELYEDRDKRAFLTIDELGNVVKVAEWRGTDLWVRKQYLRRYQAARQLALDLQVVVDQRGGGELAHLADVDCDVSEDNVIFAYHGGSIPMPGDDPYFARLIGKRVILPQPPEFSDVWPYEKPRQFESFIIGTDDDGNPIAHTCDPKALANNFGANAGAPNYLTPVFFERNVLDKYYGDSDRYRVEDGYLRETSTWGLRMDNALEDRVAVFLGDLGTDIPYREQQYWKSFNVPPSGTMSKTAIRRSFLGQFADSERVEHRFVNAYKRLTDAWAEKYGWPLYKELHEGDAHIINSIHVPTNPSFVQFDDQIVRLAKLVVDSLNEESIVLATGSRGKSEKGIAKLQRLLDEKGISDTLCAELARVQGARTRSAAHRKGSDFNLSVLLDGNADLPTLFNDLLERLIVAFDQLSAAIGVAEAE